MLRVEGSQIGYVASGCIAPREEALPRRLAIIHEGISQLVEEHSPDEVAIEQVFMARNAQSALVLGQARGAAIAAVTTRALPLSEYAARQVKLAVAGTGKADKSQIQHMVQVLLALSGKPQADAADALAIALCHVNTSVLSRDLG